MLLGLTARSSLIECPLGAFEVLVTTCRGEGDCVAACPVNVFERGTDGKCTVVNDLLCFGCMTCVAQCLDGGVRVSPAETQRFLTVEELLR